ncbi:MAG TPA: helix-turn-helix domain-containing protein, partial [Bacteroidales bacterium]|jgi:AcrR family transcriptional regulator|nr:helix-turn-helix domain-containing protein [Bacteroidales bacterium]HOU82127.1 helix-turn-helix domain-containing protein [Bacteroidales bacterium]
MNKNKTKNLILKKAAEVFAAKGIEKTTIEDITKKIGKAKSSIYYYFNDKEELFKEVLENEIENFKNEVIKKLNTTVDPITKLRIYFELRMKKTKELVNLFMIKTNEMTPQVACVNEIRKKYDEEEINIIKGILEEGDRRNIFYFPNIENATLVIATALKISELPFIIPDYISNYDEMMDSLIDMVLYGIVKR